MNRHPGSDSSAGRTPRPDSIRLRQLAQAATLLQRGNPAGARRLLQAFLDAHPTDADALHLMGVAAGKQGHHPAAEDCLRQALAHGGERPAVLNDLANLLAGLGRAEEALVLYQRAVELDPQFADGWFNLALAQQKLGNHASALECLQRAARLKPEDARFANARGLSLKALDRLDEAVEAYDQALATQPDYLRALHNKGVALRLLGKPDAAMGCYRRVLRLQPDQPEAHYNLACALHDAGRLEETEAELLRAVALKPDFLAAHETLNKMYWELGRKEDFCRSYQQAVTRLRHHGPLRAAHAGMLEMAGRFDAAREVLQEGLKAVGDDASLLHGLAKAAGRRGETLQSLALFDRAIALDPGRMEVRIDVSRYLIQLGDYQAALGQLEAAERLDPLNQEMWAYRGLCWRFLGDERAAWLNDYDRLVQVRRLQPPEGYDDLEHFLDALRRVMIPMHETVTHPIDQSLRGGTQTPGRLIHQPIKEIQEFRQALETQIRDYLAGLPRDPSHPFLGRLTGGFRFTGSWSVRLQREGFHVNHVHPQGWLSGPTYIEVPGVVREDDPDRAGWVKFGETGLELGPEREEVAKAVCPRPGLCAFFPSYTWHGTYPFDSDDHRMTAPMDCLPD